MPLHSTSTHLSYKKYHQMAADLCHPFGEDLTLETRFELYLSRILYLENMIDKLVKQDSTCANVAPLKLGQDLHGLRNDIDLAKEFLKDTVLQRLSESFRGAERHYNRQVRNRRD